MSEYCHHIRRKDTKCFWVALKFCSESQVQIRMAPDQHHSMLSLSTMGSLTKTQDQDV